MENHHAITGKSRSTWPFSIAKCYKSPVMIYLGPWDYTAVVPVVPQLPTAIPSVPWCLPRCKMLGRSCSRSPSSFIPWSSRLGGASQFLGGRMVNTLWLCQHSYWIAIGNGDVNICVCIYIYIEWVFPLKTWGFSVAMLNYQRVMDSMATIFETISAITANYSLVHPQSR